MQSIILSLAPFLIISVSKLFTLSSNYVAPAQSQTLLFRMNLDSGALNADVGSYSLGLTVPNGIETGTATFATPCVFTFTTNPWANNQAVILSGTVPGGFTAGTVYYVVNATSTTFELSATSGGASIASTSASSSVTATVTPGGTITVVPNPKKDAINGSNWVTRHYVPAGYARAELNSQYITVNETTMTYNMSYYIPFGFSSGIEVWDRISQFATYPCGVSQTGNAQICQTGSDDGIFDEIKVNQNPYPWRITFRHRAQPDCSYSDIPINPNEWNALTFQIKWTKTLGAGFIRIWQNGVLVVDREGIKTMFDDNTCQMFWTTGLYAGFNTGDHEVFTGNQEIWNGLKDPGYYYRSSY